MKLYPVSLFVCLILAFAFSACNEKDQWQKESAGLQEQIAALESRHCRLKTSTDSLWDATSLRLSHAFPPDFPIVDREIFLKARNAAHMKMFMSYKLLDSTTQDMIEDAGKYDDMIAADIHKLLEEQQVFEQQKIRFLEKVGKQDTAASHMYAGQFRKAAAGACY